MCLLDLPMKNSWDEWVGTSRLMELSDDNLEIQKKLFKDQNVDKQSKGRVSQGKQKTPAESKGEKEGGKSNSVSKGKKRKAESAVSEEKDTDEPDQVMKIPIPAVLKKQLVDDWELIQSGKSIKLPRKPCVDEILKTYREMRTKREGTDEDSVGEVLEGLQAYFDRALPAMLLYKQERAQYGEAISEGSSKPPSLTYGAEHLLRLFVRLPELLAFINMEDEALNQLQQRLQDFLKFLQKNQSSFFLSMYDGPKVGTQVEPEEKKSKRDNLKIEEDRKERSGTKVAEDKREKRVGQRLTEDKRERKDSSKLSEDRSARKDTIRTGEEKRDRKEALKSSDEKRDKKDAVKASEEKRRKDNSRVRDEAVRGTNDKVNKKDGSKGDRKEKRDRSRPSENKDGSKVLDKKEKKVVSKGPEDKLEKRNAPKASEEKKDRKVGTNDVDDKKLKKVIGKLTEDKKDKKHSKSSEEKKEKKECLRSSEGGEGIKESHDKDKKEVSSLSVNEDMKDSALGEISSGSEGMDGSD